VSLDPNAAREQRRFSSSFAVMGESLHIQAPSAMSALVLRHRLNALNVEADVMPAGDAWDVRVWVSGDEVAAAVRRLIQQDSISAGSPSDRE
jgi:hypothetical protein